MDEPGSQAIEQETPADDVFIPPSIYENQIHAGISYTHHAGIPEVIANDMSIECVLGVDEAGRGPVLGSCYLFDKSPDTTLNHSVKAPWYIACCIFLFHVTALYLLKPIILMIQKFLPQQSGLLLCKSYVAGEQTFSRIVDGRQQRFLPETYHPEC